MALRKTASREDPQQYVLKKQYKKAIEIYRGIISGNPDDPNQHLRLGDCLVLDGQSGPAIEQYKSAAKLFADQGFLLKAIGVNKKIVKLDPSQEEVHKNLSELYEERGLLSGGAAAAAPSAAPAPVSTPPSTGGGFQFDFEDTSSGPQLDLGMDADGEGMDLELGPGADAVDAAAVPVVGEDLAPEVDTALLDGLDLTPEELPVTARPASRPPEELPNDISLDALGDALSDLPADAVSAFVAGEVPAAEPIDDLSALEGLDFDLAPDGVTADAAGSSGSAVEQSDVFRRTPLFSEFTPDEFVEVVKKLDQESYPPDSVVVKEGDPGDAMFIVVSGSVRVITNSMGKEIRLAELNEGDFFGEGSLITGKPRTASILTNEDSELLILSRAGLEEIESLHPRVRDVLTKFFQERAENTVRTILGVKK